MADDKGHLRDQKLPDGAQKAAESCRDFLRDARYRPQGDYEILDDSSLKEHGGAFFAEFAPLVKVYICRMYMEYFADPLSKYRAAAKNDSQPSGSQNVRPCQ